tara:strand:- start:12 stop:689 length:678 start_codon:yes stop_codon:yes gene_type:complete
MRENQDLDGPSIINNINKKINKIVIMLHGYGSNGNDLIQIAKIIENSLDKTSFFAPDAPYKSKNFNGYMWFEVYPNGIPFSDATDEQKSQIMKDFHNSCALIKNFIYKVSKKYNVELNRIFLLGFSQGSMMSLEVGTSLKESIGGIISLSGRIWGKNFNNIIRKKCPILIVHGSQDQIIKPFRYEETYDILNKSNFKIEKKLINNMGHNINDEVINILTNFIKYY